MFWIVPLNVYDILFSAEKSGRFYRLVRDLLILMKLFILAFLVLERVSLRSVIISAIFGLF